MRKILVVDDNLPFAENLAEILSDGGAEVDVVGTGSAALEKIERGRYDLLVSDMKMPIMGGAELVHRVRKLDSGLPAIVVTAYTKDDDLQAARREGLLAVLPKPVPLPQLLALAARARRDALVAVVDDDADFADNLSEALRERGFAALTAASVLETERLGPVRPFAALVDLRLPDGPDGLALTRLSAKYPGIPLLVVSAHDRGELPEPCLARFHKPFPIENLLGELERLHAAAHA
jgi:CheY-like chemotaxis protein